MGNKPLFVFLVFLLPFLLEAEEIRIGDTRIRIPVPEGFHSVRAIPGVQVPPENEPLLWFLSASDTGAEKRGPGPGRLLSVQTGRQAIDVHMSLADFRLAKTQVKNGYKDSTAFYGSRVPGVSRVIPYPIHRETERSLSFPMLVITAEPSASGDSMLSSRFVATSLVYVKGKPLYLYANGEEKDSLRVQAIAEAWSDSVLAANPVSRADSIAEGEKTHREFAWGRFWASVAIGAAVGGLLGLLSSLLR